MIYLDNAATTFPKPAAVYDAMDAANRNLAFNAGRGSYAAARSAVAVIDETRDRMNSLLQTDGCADIIFTPSVTHALNQVVAGLAINSEANIYISPYEHNAVARTLHAASERMGFKIHLLSLMPDLKIDLNKTVYDFSTAHPDYVFMSAVSNVTGYVLPTEDVFVEAKKYGAVTIMDAAQAAGLIPLSMKTCHVDILCFAGHKTLNGPLGIAGFALRRGTALGGSFTGGTGSNSLNLNMPDTAPGKYEASSQNIPAFAGLNAALQHCDVDSHGAKVRDLTDYALQRLVKNPKIIFKGAYNDGATLGILSFVMEGYSSNEVGAILADEYDIAVRTGYHCAPYVHDFLKDKPYNGTVRIGLGLFNTVEDIDALADAMETL